MDFVLKTLSLEQAAKSAVDSLIVLWPEGAKAQGDDALSQWAAQVVAGGDLEDGVAKAVVGARLPDCTVYPELNCLHPDMADPALNTRDRLMTLVQTWR
jgi:hypothetical protein